MTKAATTPTTVSSRDEPVTPDEPAQPPWLAIVAERVRTMRYGVVQIVVHDGKVVQVERTERTRFDVPNSGAGK